MKIGAKKVVLVAGVLGAVWALSRAWKVYQAKTATAKKTATVVSSAVQDAVTRSGVNAVLF